MKSDLDSLDGSGSFKKRGKRKSSVTSDFADGFGALGELETWQTMGGVATSMIVIGWLFNMLDGD